MLKNLYLTSRFFWVFGGLIFFFLLSFAFNLLFPLAQVLFVIVLGTVIFDIFLLFNRNTKVTARRHLPKVLSLGDPNTVRLSLQNPTRQKLSIHLIDEMPSQFQVRDREELIVISPEEEKEITYTVKPIERGEYTFNDINLFLSSLIGLVQRRVIVQQTMTVPVFPSIVQMKQLELRAFDRVMHHKGIKKLRRIGHSYEFEQIKNYVPGDDYRSINWKASSRKAIMMVNQYEDERAQQIYSIIDKGRSMRMPFEGLSLMDYAVNASLAISNIALRKHDRAGLISFSDKIGTTLKADSKPTQLNKILHTLYKEKERPLESNFELLYHAVRKLIAGRSLLLLFTNFESMYALERVLPVLRKINTFHLLVVVFFENTEIKSFAEAQVETLEDIYHQTIAQKFLAEKNQMVQKLQQFGIQAVLTPPQDLSINTINKYLELKARGLI